ncbi:MAG: hypothetical protein HY554_07540 [Elusimicrobia bacterium]|nr:hypothetical protein [Elusimicrobiota bacterium]
MAATRGSALRLGLALTLLWGTRVQAVVEEAGAPPSGAWELDRVPERPADDGSPSAVEQLRFWDRLQQRAFDDLCRGLELPLSREVAIAELGRAGVSVKRELERYPNTLAVVDTSRLELSLGHGEKLLSLAQADIPLVLSAGASLEGAAWIIRPLDGQKSCREVRHLLDVLDFKTVVPVKEERLAGMRVGELWKLPLVLTAGARLSAGAPAGPASISLSFGVTQRETASATLHRLREDALRFRLRIDRVRIRDATGGVDISLPLAEYLGFTDPGSLVERAAQRQALRIAHDYAFAGLGLSRWKGDGRKVLLEFLLDPRDPGQLAALTRFLKGDLDVLAILLRVAHSAANPAIREGAPADYLAALEARHSARLGAELEYSGTDDYRREGSRLHVKLPLLASLDFGETRDRDLMVPGAKDVTVRLSEASRTGDHGFLRLPFLGDVFTRASQDTVQAFTQTDAKGFPSAPALVYIQQRGFRRFGEGSARGMIEDVNAIMRLAGARGEGTDPGLAVPASEILPPEEPGALGASLYHMATSAFTLVLKQAALEQLLWAPAEAVLKAYANSLGREGESLREAAARAPIEVDCEAGSHEEGLAGALRASLDAALASPPGEPASGAWTAAMELARSAAGLVGDLCRARAGDWGERTQALVSLVSGRGSSRLSFAEAMKVLVQLVDPAQVYGEFSVNLEKRGKGEKDVAARYRLNKDAMDESIRLPVRMKERFAEPSRLSD